MVGRVEVEPDDVAHLVDEQRIARQPEGLGAVGPDVEERQHARDRTLGKPARRRGGPHGPVGRTDRLALQDGAQEACDALFVVGPRTPGPGFAVEPGQALLEPDLAPVADRRVRNAEAICDRRVGLARRGREDDLRSPHEAMGGRL